MIWPVLGMVAFAIILFVVGRAIEAEEIKRLTRRR